SRGRRGASSSLAGPQRPDGHGVDGPQRGGGSAATIRPRDMSVSTKDVTEIGAHRRRVEDPRLLRGQGSYVDDLRLPGTVDVAFVRSSYPHARLRRVNLDAARRLSGVLAAWSGENVRDVPRVPSRLRVSELKLSPL